jgi:hypothetical protein
MGAENAEQGRKQANRDFVAEFRVGGYGGHSSVHVHELNSAIKYFEHT